MTVFGLFPDELTVFLTERVEKGQRLIDQINEKEKSQRVVGQLEMPVLFGRVPWGHHIDIVSRCETIDKKPVETFGCLL